MVFENSKFVSTLFTVPQVLTVSTARDKMCNVCDARCKKL